MKGDNMVNKSEFVRNLFEWLMFNVDSAGILWTKTGLELHHTVINIQVASKEVLIIPITSYSSDVFVIEIKDSFQTKLKFVLKIRKILPGKKCKLLSEFEIYKYLNNSGIVNTIIAVAYAMRDSHGLGLYVYDESVTGDKVSFDINQIKNIYSKILDLQDLLFKSRIPVATQLSRTKESDIDYNGKLIKYLSYFTKKATNSSLFADIQFHLNTDRMKKLRAIVSDRSPANWMVNDKGIFPFDFDLVLWDSCLSDFVFFIDDHRLKVSHSRNRLVSCAIEVLSIYNRNCTEEDFHFNAVYRNLIQGVLLYEKNIYGSLWSYRRALDSAVFLNLWSVQQFIIDLLYKIA